MLAKQYVNEMFCQQISLIAKQSVVSAKHMITVMHVLGIMYTFYS